MNKFNFKHYIVLYIFNLILNSTVVYGRELPDEVNKIKQKFNELNSNIEVPSNYRDELTKTVNLKFLSSPGYFPHNSQYIFLVDRNPKVQIGALAFFDAEDKNIIILGIDKVSTGNPKKVGYYETPVGIFKNLPDNMSYRALGTKNSKGWRAFGVKGSRVWDLGWQKSRNIKNPDINIRMLIHATDPDHGEKRLGTQDSKGCIRVSAKLNHFLDYYGILDAEFEKTIKRKYVLLKDRETVSFAGNTIVVVDSS